MFRDDGGSGVTSSTISTAETPEKTSLEGDERLLQSGFSGPPHFQRKWTMSAR